MVKKIRKSLALLFFILLIVVLAFNTTACSEGCMEKFEINTYDVTENFDSVSIKTETADISVHPSDDGTCKVVCYEKNNLTYSVSVDTGILTVKVNDARKWFTNINLFSGKPKVTVYLPKTEYDSLVIEESTGDIEIPNDFKFESIDLSLSTGKVKCYAKSSNLVKITTSTGDVVVDGLTANALDVTLSTGDVTVTNTNVSSDVKVTVSTGKTHFTNLNCKNLTSNGNTGKMILTNVLVSENLTVDRSTGDVIFESSDAGEIFVKTDTGEVKGSLRSAKIFITETDTGRINVPSTTTGGKCQITTDTGNINITIN